MKTFDYINNINDKKIKNVEVDSEYVPYITNKFFSFFPETSMIANMANSLHGMDKQAHYDFLFAAIPKNKRYTKWIKNAKDNNIELISEYYSVSVKKAKEINRLLNENDIKFISCKLNKGGVK